MVIMLDENSNLWSATDVREVGLAKNNDMAEDEAKIPGFADDSDDKETVERIDYDRDFRCRWGELVIVKKPKGISSDLKVTGEWAM